MKPWERVRLYYAKWERTAENYRVFRFKEYDGEFDLVNEGTEDFTDERVKFEHMAWYTTHIWTGKRNAGNHKWWVEKEEVLIKRKDVKKVKEYLKAKYPEAVEVQLRKVWELK